jgi:hypothetical protein
MPPDLRETVIKKAAALLTSGIEEAFVCDLIEALVRAGNAKAALHVRDIHLDMHSLANRTDEAGRKPGASMGASIRIRLPFDYEIAVKP